jgi:hypothetical protein
VEEIGLLRLAPTRVPIMRSALDNIVQMGLYLESKELEVELDGQKTRLWKGVEALYIVVRIRD